MNIKNSFLISILFYLPCLGMGFQNSQYLNFPYISYSQEYYQTGRISWGLGDMIHNEYEAIIDKAIADKKDLSKCLIKNEPLLIQVIRQNFIDLAEKLLVAGANVEVKGFKYNSPLETAIHSGRLKIIKLLIAHKANVNSNGGWSPPLFKAIICSAKNYKNNVRMIQLLLDAGATVNNKYAGKTALHKVLEKYYLCNNLPIEISSSIVKELIKNGADCNIKNNLNNTPLDLAQENFPELVPIIHKQLEIRGWKDIMQC